MSHYIISRAYIYAYVTWDSSQLTAAQAEGEVLADILISAFNPKPTSEGVSTTFARDNVCYTFFIDNSLYSEIKTKCLLGIKHQLTIPLRYRHAHSASTE